MKGIMTAHDAKELSRILKTIKNTGASVTPDFGLEPQKETWFDRWVLRWF